MLAITIICGVLALIFSIIAIVCALYARKKYVKLQNEIENAKQKTSAYEAREQQARNELDKCLLKKAQTEGELSAL
jgi:preprotein translocase subunit SecG